MNLYIHVEVSVRELDSKLLLAILAASRGHNVILSDLSGIIRGLRFRAIKPGIFHTKSLSPTPNRVKLHNDLIEKGFKITSIDEEGCLAEYGYETFAKIRYSKETVKQASAIFGWGSEDTNTLKKIYNESATKIFKTGSPRADLWRDIFSSYWKLNSTKIEKPFLLVSSSFSHANNVRPLHERLKVFINAGYYDRAPELFEKYFIRASEDYVNTAAFIEAIKYLSKNNNGYHILVRPHPTEYVESWKTYLKNIPNVHVIREDSITLWVRNAFAVLHFDCTTAMEALIANKPVITYSPFEMRTLKKLANDLGDKTNTLKDLMYKVNNLNDQINKKNKKINISLPNSVIEKIFIDEELASKKIINVWESLSLKKFENYKNLIKLKFILKMFAIKDKIFDLLSIVFFNKLALPRNTHKFQKLEIDDLKERILKFKEILKIDKEIECELLADRTVLIKRR